MYFSFYRFGLSILVLKYLVSFHLRFNYSNSDFQFSIFDFCSCLIVNRMNNKNHVSLIRRGESVKDKMR